MVEILSPLKTKCVSGQYGASGEAGLKLSQRPLRGLWQVAGWDTFETAAAPALADLGLDGLGGYRHAQRNAGVTAFRIAPDKLLIEGCGDLSGHASDELVVLDLSHARVAIALSGFAARDLLMQVVAIDLSETAFQPGEFVQSGIHHVGVLIHCTGFDTFEILVPGTWAETTWEVLFENALPHGLVVAEAA